MVAKSSVSVLVVSADEQINFFGGWENINSIKTGAKLEGIDLSVSWNIEDVKGISNVEVVLLGKKDLGILEFLLLIAKVLKSVDEFIFIVNSENWLSAW